MSFALARHQFSRQIVPQFVADDAIHRCHPAASARRSTVTRMRLEFDPDGPRAPDGQGCIEHGLLPIDQYISNAGIDHSILIEDLEMAQKQAASCRCRGRVP